MNNEEDSKKGLRKKVYEVFSLKTKRDKLIYKNRKQTRQEEIMRSRNIQNIESEEIGKVPIDRDSMKDLYSKEDIQRLDKDITLLWAKTNNVKEIPSLVQDATSSDIFKQYTGIIGLRKLLEQRKFIQQHSF